MGKKYNRKQEAEIVYIADMRSSAKYHRINPIQANDILELAVNGKNIKDIEEEIKLFGKQLS